MPVAPKPPLRKKLPTAQTDPQEAPPDVPIGAAEPVQTTLSPPHIIRLVIVNTLVLAQLCLAISIAAQHPEEMVPVFYRVFLSLLLPTLILGTYSKRFLPTLQAQQRQQVQQ